MASSPEVDTSDTPLLQSSNVPKDEQRSSYQKVLGKIHDFLESSIKRPYVRDLVGHRPSNILRDYPQPPNNYIWRFSPKYPSWPRNYLSNWSSEEKAACLNAMENGDLKVIDLSLVQVKLSAKDEDMDADAPEDYEEKAGNQIDEHKAEKNDDEKKGFKSSAMPEDKQLCHYQKCIGKLHVLVETAINRPYVFKSDKHRWTDIINDHPQAPNAYRWIFSTQYPQFPPKFPSLWHAAECRACVEAIDKGWLYVEALPLDGTSAGDSIDKSPSSGLAESDNGVPKIKTEEDLQQAVEGLKAMLTSEIQREQLDNIISYHSTSTAAFKTEIASLKKQIAKQTKQHKAKLIEHEEEIDDIIERSLQVDEEREEAFERFKKLHVLEVKLLQERLKKYGDKSMDCDIMGTLREQKEKDMDDHSSETDGGEDSETTAGPSSLRRNGQNEGNEEDKENGEESAASTTSPFIKRPRLNDNCM